MDLAYGIHNAFAAIVRNFEGSWTIAELCAVVLFCFVIVRKSTR